MVSGHQPATTRFATSDLRRQVRALGAEPVARGWLVDWRWRPTKATAGSPSGVVRCARGDDLLSSIFGPGNWGERAHGAGPQVQKQVQ